MANKKKFFFWDEICSFFFFAVIFPTDIDFLLVFWGVVEGSAYKKSSPRFYFPTYICLVVFCLAKIVCSALGWGMDVKTQNQTLQRPCLTGNFSRFCLDDGKICCWEFRDFCDSLICLFCNVMKILSFRTFINDKIWKFLLITAGAELILWFQISKKLQ